MSNLRPTRQKRGLPLRWVVILSIGAAAGIAVGCLTNVAGGVAAGVGLATFLHKVID